jgi:AraC-like DNA-binding protein
MLKAIRPTVDNQVRPWAGRSRGGQPMSFNRAPSKDLEPWLGRVYATPVDLPDDYEIVSGLLNDCSMVRIQLSGKWQAHTADGVTDYGPAALIFGPHSKFMRIKVTGSFVSIGLALRPGAGHAIFGVSASEVVDRIVPFERVGLDSQIALNNLNRYSDATSWVDTVEARFRQIVEAKGRPLPDPVTTAFENLAYENPSANLTEFAEELGISMRQMQRIINRDFGMAPKQVLRRSRALDMASHLHGVADEKEADDLILRYFDQAQMTREFTEFFGMTPRQFMKTPNPLMTLTLEARQAKRLEMLKRLPPGATRPWQ